MIPDEFRGPASACAPVIDQPPRLSLARGRYVPENRVNLELESHGRGAGSITCGGQFLAGLRGEL